jgi:heme exporter protein D
MAPQFQTLGEFTNMGGYAGFVFSAWGLSICVIAILIGRAILTGKRQKARLDALELERQGK